MSVELKNSRPILVVYMGCSKHTENIIDQLLERAYDVLSYIEDSGEYFLIIIPMFNERDSSIEVLSVDDINTHELSNEISSKLDELLIKMETNEK